MRSIVMLFILAGAVGCRADHASQSSSQMAEQNGTTSQPSISSPSQQGSSAEAAGSTRIPNHPEDKRPLLVCFGDSLTAGFGADEGSSYPDFLQKDLDRDGYHYRVVNEGISGNTTKDGVDRLADILAMKPAVVVVEFGGNDGLRGFKTQTTRENLSTMLAGLKQAGAKTIIAGITLPPDYGPDYITSFTGNYTALGKQYGVPVLPFLLKNVYGVPGLMQADNIHATAKGNEVVARNVLPYVEPLLKK